MKTKIVFLLSAIVCLASCNKQDLITPEHDENEGKEGDYRIEIVDLQSPTKSSPSTVQLSLANLTKASSKRVSAQLKKKSGSNWVDVTTGVVYSWSASSSDSKKFDGSGTVNQSCDISAKATGSGTITVSANLNSTVVATQDVPVTVSDDRALSWSNATTSITSGEVKTATLNSNFSCTATISSNNGSFLVGTSSTNLSSTASVTFSTNQTKTIYYKYTGSEQTTVKIEAKNIDSQKSSRLEILTTEKLGTICAYGEQEISPDAYYHPDYPAGTYTVKIKDNTLPIWQESHEYDLQYETTACHSLTIYKIGYLDDSGIFHEFSDYKVYKNTNLTGELRLSSCAIGVLSSASASDDEFNWSSGSTHRTATVYISVRDEGYQGTYIGTCDKYNYL